MAKAMSGAERLKPRFAIIGTGKGGTTSLFLYLVQHPKIAEPMVKEINFFYRHWDRGLKYYFAHFPRRADVADDVITGDASPGYLANEVTPERLASILPEIKLIALLRDPIARVISHHHHDIRSNNAPKRDLADCLIPEGMLIAPERTLALAEELGRGVEPATPPRAGEFWPHHYMRSSLYADHLERWLKHFPREQMLILRSEDMFADPQGVYAKTLDFIGAPPHDIGPVRAWNVGKYQESDERVIAYLRDIFAEPNARLASLVGDGFGWPAA